MGDSIPGPAAGRRRAIAATAGTLVTAVAYYASTGLEPRWPLVWIAPIPVLALALRASAGATAIAAFAAHAIGGLNMASYLSGVVPIPVVIAAVVGPALVFCLAVLSARFAVLTWRHWASVLAFPGALTAYEYASSVLSPHGSFGSLAYTQASMLPIVQLAAVTGLWGISFLLTLLPAGVVAAWHWRSQRRLARSALLASALVVLVVAAAGSARLAWSKPRDPMPVGVAATDTSIRSFDTQERAEALAVLAEYRRRIEELARRGTHVIVLPEKFVGVAPGYADEASAILSQAARAGAVTVVAGLNRVGIHAPRNTAVVFGPDGRLLLEYDKVFLVPVWEAGYRTGNAPGLFSLPAARAGVAICKDMDFPHWTRRYARGGARILFVPAWDFVRDRRLHARMAVMRGVEGGFAVVRSAQQGLLTVSDHLGRILFERASSDEASVLLSGAVSPGPGVTPYARLGDWFGVASVALSVTIPAIAWRVRSRRRHERARTGDRR